jgi:SNF2 family DNA or RNA helicase
MLVLHGAWRPDGGGLALWGEGDEIRRARRGKALRHPFAAEGAPLGEAWRELGGKSEGAAASDMRLLLPTAGGRPLPSPEHARLDEESAPRDAKEVTLAEWVLPAQAVAPFAALRWLAQLPREKHPAPDLYLGVDLRFWSEAARLALELIGRQRFVPTVAVTGDQFVARWEPLWDDPADARRLTQLAEAMPSACRAIAREGGAPAARALLEQFFQQCVDAAVREWSNDSAPGPPRALKNMPSGEGADVDRWLAALTGASAALSGGRALMQRLARRVEEWTGQLRARTSAGFRTCFQLEPPEIEGGASAAPTGAASANPALSAPDWRLTFWLQALDDPSLRVAAAHVWELGGRPLRMLNRRFENPQERLLEDLGRACRLFPPVAGSLREARPQALPLDLNGAYQFLREATPLLEESGYGVLVPSWWNKPASRLSLRLRLRPAQRGSRRSPKGAGLGMDSLVQFDWQASLGGESLTREEFDRLAALKTPLVSIRGQWVELRPEDLQAALRAWETGQGGELTTLGEALHAQAEVAAHGLAVEAVEAEGWLQSLLDGSDQDHLETLPAPSEFTGTLRPYQTRGYSWLAFLRERGLGACLADDMGLGKTPQCLAALLRRREEAGGSTGPVLLVCPTSVAENWRREAARFAPSLRVLLHHGPGRSRGDDFLAQAAEHDLVVTTFALIPRDLETLRQAEWDTVVLDEAQNIKNPEAKQTRAIRALPAGWRVALTGTPVENRLRELWSIMEFLNPRYLGPEATFHRRFAVPIERYSDETQSATLRRLIQPFVLRRVKTDPKVIQDLPEKLEQKVFCPLTPEQATLYEAVVKDMLEQVDDAEDMARRGLVLATLMKLKQVCNHPAHFLGDGSALPHRSGKLNRLEELLEEALSVEDHALVFTQFAAMGEKLQRHLRQRFGIDVLFLHGGVPRAKRDQMVARFQAPEGPPVMVLSLKAGGVGLNLTRANHVFHFDRWWNPAVENQATDRAFRIGQRRNVHVHKFVCTGTVEERIDALIESKLALAESIVGAGESWITELSSAELRDLFTLRREAVAEEG